MASELRVNTLKDASGNNSVGMSTVAQGSAKVWAAFGTDASLDDSHNASSATDNGTAKVWIDVAQDFASIADSYNVSSLDDDGTGDGGLNYTSNFGSANYVPSISTDDRGASTGSSQGDFTNGTKAAGGIDFEVYYVFSTSNRTNYDMAPYINIHGDLA